MKVKPNSTLKKPEWSHRAGLSLVILAAALCGFLTGCNPAPKYARPPAQTPAAFKEIPPEFKEGSGWKIAQPGDEKLRANWWQLYNDPQLAGLEEQVQISNQTVLAAEANFRAARALVISIKSALAPTLTVGPSYSNSRSSSTSKGTRAELATDYFELRSLDAQRRILEDTVANYRDALNLTKSLYTAGINSEEEVSQAQTQLDTTVAQLTDLGVARAQYEHAIATLIGKPASNFS